MTPEQTKRLEELREAFLLINSDIFDSIDLGSLEQYENAGDKYCQAYKRIEEAAQAFAEVFETLCTLDEVGQMATEGYFEFNEENEWGGDYTVSCDGEYISDNATYYNTAPDMEDAKFLAEAANARPQIAKAVRDE